MISLKSSDPKVYRLIQAERKRQQDGLELIPSENYVSKSVLEALGSILTNKYSEGYPGKRYYGGQEWIDKVENLARQRALDLFIKKSDQSGWHVNVQPYSGSPANIAVYFALADFGSRLMGMSLTQGGHLTHGHKVNFSGRAYKFIQYSLGQDERLDYDQISKLAKQYRPKIIVSGATAYSRVIDFRRFQDIAESIGAVHMADVSHIAGLIIARVHPSPFPFTDVVTTTTHKTLRGPRGAIILCQKRYAQAIDRAVFPGLQGGPHDHTTAAMAVAFKEASSDSFKKYGRQIVKNAQALAHELDLYGYRIVSQGTDNHLLLVDLSPRAITGSQAQEVLEQVGITVNKNTVPNESRSPFDPSGIRLGTPALTSRNMKEKEMGFIAGYIDATLETIKTNDTKKRRAIAASVARLAGRFPVPGIKA